MMQEIEDERIWKMANRISIEKKGIHGVRGKENECGCPIAIRYGQGEI